MKAGTINANQVNAIDINIYVYNEARITDKAEGE